MDLFLSTRCPQCGADISFEEESTVLYCDYCGTALRITGRSGVMRTYVAPREDIKRIKKAINGAVKQTNGKKVLVRSV
jgi:ribosomal protein S27E